MSLTIAITTEGSRHIGFLFLAPNAVDTATGVELGDCIFRSLPVQSEDFTHELAERLYDYQQRGEFEYRSHCSDGATSVAVTIDEDLHIQVDLDTGGQGSISEVRQGKPAFRMGLAEATKPR